MRDRRRYLHWVFEAKKRFGLSVLNYMVTSNHVHLLVKDTGGDVIAQSMQLIAGRTAQEYNQRKNRHGAFWEDRYHATAIQADVLPPLQERIIFNEELLEFDNRRQFQKLFVSEEVLQRFRSSSSTRLSV